MVAIAANVKKSKMIAVLLAGRIEPAWNVDVKTFLRKLFRLRNNYMIYVHNMFIDI